MRTLGNIIWHFPFFGFVVSLCYAISGLLWCITIVGIPLGLGLFQLSLFTLAPFSKRLVSISDLELLTGEKQDSLVKGWFLLIRILYFPFGLFFAFSTILVIAAEFLSIIGIPFGLVLAKALSTIFNPVNKKCVPRAVAEEIERRKANNTLNKYIKSDNISSNQGVAEKSDKAIRNDDSITIANTEYPRKAETKSTEGVSIVAQSEATTSEFDDEKYRAYQPPMPKSVEESKPEPIEENKSFGLTQEERMSEAKETNRAVLFSILGGGLLIVVGLLVYFQWYVPYAKDRDALRTYVVANNVFLRSSKMSGVEYNILGKVPYGAEVVTYNKLGDWAEVKVNGREGVIATPYLLDSWEFILLNDAWGDNDAKECIESTKCRLAILDYLKRNKISGGPNGWQIYTKPSNQKPNSVFYPRLYNKYSKFTDFVFLIKNNQTGQRALVCYSFDDTTEKPIFRFSVGAPETGYIKNVVSKYGGARVVFDNNSYLNISF